MTRFSKWKALSLVGGAAIGLTLGSAASAQQTQIALGSAADYSSSQLEEASSLPAAGSTITVGGVNFALAGTPGSAFNSIYLENPDSVTLASPVTLSVSVPNVSTIYTLGNSGYGETGVTIASITFKDAANDVYTYDYTEGSNVRDYYYNVFNNNAPNVYGTAVYGPGGYQNQDNFDAQQIVLPSGFASSTLTSITITATQGSGYPNGQLLLTGITAVTAAPMGGVPEPATWAMVILGFGIAGAALRRRPMVAPSLA